MSKPKITTRPVASNYESRDERIIEFTGTNGGGLISVINFADRTRVDVYQQDNGVEVAVSRHRVIRDGELTEGERALARVLDHLAAVQTGDDAEIIREQVTELIPPDVRQLIAARGGDTQADA